MINESLRHRIWCGLLLVLPLGVSLTGCLHDAGPPVAGVDPSEEEQIQASLAKLNADDRKAAEEQRLCPVTDARLGIMGAPVKVTVNDQDVWICCAGCKTELEEHPDQYLGKLKKSAN